VGCKRRLEGGVVGRGGIILEGKGGIGAKGAKGGKGGRGVKRGKGVVCYDAIGVWSVHVCPLTRPVTLQLAVTQLRLALTAVGTAVPRLSGLSPSSAIWFVTKKQG
jgi:hypothetical protein